jgi:hypothetical protein
MKISQMIVVVGAERAHDNSREREKMMRAERERAASENRVDVCASKASRSFSPSLIIMRAKNAQNYHSPLTEFRLLLPHQKVDLIRPD